ncbi:MAG: 5'/3'-nucleotidase SurE [Pirellula sp.]
MLSTLDVDFLLTNDDGIEAIGLQSLCQAIEALGSIAVVAPDTVRSCCSHMVTTAESLIVERLDSVSWKVSGTPADCIRIAIKHLRIRPKWILSGVNEGGNLGVDIHYSGTVAGAREASLLGFRSMAISQYLRRDRPRDWPLTARRAIYAWTQLQSIDLSPNQFWNVNLPVVDRPQVELAIVHSDPEPQMLGYDFEPIEDQPSDDFASAQTQWVKYRSNYQERPRQEQYDVANCFSGNITATRLGARIAGL